MTNLKNMAGLCTAFASGFHPRLWTTLLTLALVALFVSLGQWQWGKAERKAAAQALLDARTAEAPLLLPATPITDVEAFRYRRVAVQGRYRASGQILLDNQIVDERAGYNVMTPLVIDGANESNGMEVLIDRGWVPAAVDRRLLPQVAVPPAPTILTGIAVVPSRKFFMLAPDDAPAGDNARWQALDLDRYAKTAKVALQPVVIRLDADQPGGFLRAWPRPDDRNERHRSYALQWFGFAASSVGIWAWLAFRRQA
jgi:surfeit locus 1 family protein